MIFEISSSVLSPILTTMAKLIGGKTPMPILEKVKIFEQNGNYLITATSGDQEAILTASLPLENVVGFHPMLLSVDELSRMVRAAEGSIFPLTFKTGTHNNGKAGDHQLCIDYGEGEYQLTYEDINEYPVTNVGEPSSDIMLPASIIPVLSQATGFTGNDINRPIVQQVYIDARPDGDSRIVATNSRFLYIGRVPEVEVNAPMNVMINARTIGLLSQMTPKGGSIRMLKSNKFVTFYLMAPATSTQGGDAADKTSEASSSLNTVCRIDARLAEGRFPSYEKIIPKNDQSLLIDCQKFVKAVDRASVCANASTNQLRLDIVPAQSYITVTAQDVDYSRNARTSLEVADGSVNVKSATSIGFNAIYLTRCIRAIGTKDVNFTFMTGERACLFNSTDQRTTTLLMPVKLVDF